MASSPLSDGRNGNGRSPSEPDQDPVSALASDETASDLDQTASDADHGAAETDQAGAMHDKLLSESDQRASDRDQDASDRELAGPAVSAATEEVHERSREQRLQNTAERTTAAVLRTHTTFERFAWADVRDENSQLRDLAAEARDHATAIRDRAEGELLGPVAAARARAAADRARAAEDRKRAAADRALAATDREHARAALRDAHFDELTGTYRRGMGYHALESEIDRAERGSGRLVLAFVDVDDLKGLNDREGHVAGDLLLTSVATAMRSRLRSYDPVIRFGGDEFVCALTDADLADAHRRFDEIQRALGRAHPGCSISVGFAQMRTGETVDELTQRGDAALYRAKRHRDPAGCAEQPAGTQYRRRVNATFSRLRRVFTRGGSDL
jgi:diguanylate cyclase (GGDEF)-like protein